MKKDYSSASTEAEELLKDTDKLEKTLQKLEKKLATVPVVGTSLSYVPMMISLVRAYIKGEYKDIPITSIISILVALLYLLAPVDLIPDSIPGVGLIDDGVIIAGCLALIKTDILDYKVWREKNGYTFDDLVDYEEIEKEASSHSKILNAYFQGKKSSK